MPLDRSDVEAALERKGFSRTEGDHHFFIYYTIEGLKTSVRTKVSHGTKYKTIDDGLVSLMAKQCGLTSPQFKQLVECPLDRTKYETILVDSGRVTVKKKEGTGRLLVKKQ